MEVWMVKLFATKTRVGSKPCSAGHGGCFLLLVLVGILSTGNLCTGMCLLNSFILKEHY